MITHLDLNLILREADVESLVASRMPLEPYSVIALELGESISRLNPEEVTKENVMKLIIQVWKKSFNLDDRALENRIPAFSPIVDRIMQEVDRVQELDPS